MCAVSAVEAKFHALTDGLMKSNKLELFWKFHTRLLVILLGVLWCIPSNVFSQMSLIYDREENNKFPLAYDIRTTGNLPLTFDRETTSNFPWASKMVLCDMNRDGSEELVTYYWLLSSPTIRIWKWQDGGFITKWADSSDGYLFDCIACGDVNNDGKNEVVLSKTSAKGNRLLLLNFDGSNYVKTFIETKEGYKNIGIGDVNGDGKNELIGVRVDESGDEYLRESILILSLKGNTITKLAESKDHYWINDLLIVDIHGTGKSSIIVAEHQISKIHGKSLDYTKVINTYDVSKSDISQVSALKLIVGEHLDTNYPKLAFLDIGGKKHLFTVKDGRVDDYEIAPKGISFSSEILKPGRTFSSITAGVYDGGGVNCLLLSTIGKPLDSHVSARGFQIYSFGKIGSLPGSNSLPAQSDLKILNEIGIDGKTELPSGYKIAMADLNSDGVSEVISLGLEGRYSDLKILNWTDQGFSRIWNKTGLGIMFGFATGDIDNDGKNDLIVSGIQEDKPYLLRVSSGQDNYVTEFYPQTVKYDCITIGDINSDGRNEIIAARVDQEQEETKDESIVVLGFHDNAFHSLSESKDHQYVVDMKVVDIEGGKKKGLYVSKFDRVSVNNGYGYSDYPALFLYRWDKNLQKEFSVQLSNDPINGPPIPRLLLLNQGNLALVFRSSIRLFDDQSKSIGQTICDFGEKSFIGGVAEGVFDNAHQRRLIVNVSKRSETTSTLQSSGKIKPIQRQRTIMIYKSPE